MLITTLHAQTPGSIISRKLPARHDGTATPRAQRAAVTSPTRTADGQDRTRLPASHAGGGNKWLAADV